MRAREHIVCGNNKNRTRLLPCFELLEGNSSGRQASLQVRTGRPVEFHEQTTDGGELWCRKHSWEGTEHHAAWISSLAF